MAIAHLVSKAMVFEPINQNPLASGVKEANKERVKQKKVKFAFWLVEISL